MYRKLVQIYRWVLPMILMFIVGIISIIPIYLSFGYLRNFFVRHVFRHTSRFYLFASGYTLELPPIENFPKHQVMYTVNHNSYLDIFVLMALGLPNVRNIISEVALKFIPLTICAKAVGTFYIPQKKHPERRLRYFIRMTSFIRRTNYSVFASPEGVRKYVHGIMPFNKGIFHMAMAAGIPIVPLFIDIPEVINPYKGQYSESGRIRLHILDEIPTSSWKLETIWEHIAGVRKVYVDHFNKVNNTDIV